MEKKSENQWLVLKVRNRNERRISNIIEDRIGLVTKVPTQKLFRYKFGKREFFEKPILSTYVFLQTNIEQIDRKYLFSISGVFGFLRNDQGPLRIPGNQIELIEKLGKSDTPVCEIDYSKLKLNGPVEVIDGPLKGLKGYFIKLNQETGTLLVNYTMFRRLLVTELAIGQVQPY